MRCHVAHVYVAGVWLGISTIRVRFQRATVASKMSLVPVEFSILSMAPVSGLGDCTRVTVRCLLHEDHAGRVQDHELTLRLLIRLPPDSPDMDLQQATLDKAEKVLQRVIAVASLS